jgi:hypothetical protein
MRQDWGVWRWRGAVGHGGLVDFVVVYLLDIVLKLRETYRCECSVFGET